MIFFLSGENSYNERATLDGARSSFLAKTKSASGSSVLNASERSFGDIEEALLTDNLFGIPQFVVIRGFLTEHESQGLKFLSQNAEALKRSKNLFVFVERAIPESIEKKATAFFEEYADKSRTADLLEGAKLDRWLQDEAHRHGVALSSFERSALIAAKGGSQWALSQEIEQRSLGGETAIARSHSGGDKEVFRIVDMIVQSRCSHPQQILIEMQAAGVESDNMIYTFLWKVKTIMLAYRGATKKLNPYVAKKAQEESRRLSFEGAAELFWRGVRVESLMKRDPMRADELFLGLLFEARTIFSDTHQSTVKNPSRM